LIEQTTIPIRTVKEIAASAGGDLSCILKTEAEVLELRVLASDSELLGKTDIFVVEAMVCAGCENWAAEVIKFTAEAGYRLVVISNLNHSPSTARCECVSRPSSATPAES
jgi:hypothetical protein